MDDALTIDLVRRAQSGDARSLDELFARYHERVLSMVRARMGQHLRSSLESRDVAQEALLEALKGLDRFEMRDESSLIRWLATITHHRLSATARDHRRQKRDPAQLAALDSERTLSATADTASVELSRSEERNFVDQCLADLPERWRESILLRDYAGSSWEEIARDMQLSSADAARMVHVRARSKLGMLLRARGMK